MARGRLLFLYSAIAGSSAMAGVPFPPLGAAEQGRGILIKTGLHNCQKLRGEMEYESIYDCGGCQQKERGRHF